MEVVTSTSSVQHQSVLLVHDSTGTPENVNDDTAAAVDGEGTYR